MAMATHFDIFFYQSASYTGLNKRTLNNFFKVECIRDQLLKCVMSVYRHFYQQHLTQYGKKNLH